MKIYSNIAALSVAAFAALSPALAQQANPSDASLRFDTSVPAVAPTPEQKAALDAARDNVNLVGETATDPMLQGTPSPDGTVILPGLQEQMTPKGLQDLVAFAKSVEQKMPGFISTLNICANNFNFDDEAIATAAKAPDLLTRLAFYGVYAGRGMQKPLNQQINALEASLNNASGQITVQMAKQGTAAENLAKQQLVARNIFVEIAVYFAMNDIAKQHGVSSADIDKMRIILRYALSNLPKDDQDPTKAPIKSDAQIAMETLKATAVDPATFSDRKKFNPDRVDIRFPEGDGHVSFTPYEFAVAEAAVVSEVGKSLGEEGAKTVMTTIITRKASGIGFNFTTMMFADYDALTNLQKAGRPLPKANPIVKKYILDAVREAGLYTAYGAVHYKVSAAVSGVGNGDGDYAPTAWALNKSARTGNAGNGKDKPATAVKGEDRIMRNASHELFNVMVNTSKKTKKQTVVITFTNSNITVEIASASTPKVDAKTNGKKHNPASTKKADAKGGHQKQSALEDAYRPTGSVGPVWRAQAKLG